MSRWMRILVWLGIAVVACCTFFWFFGVQTLFALEARYIGRKSPVVKRVPIELSDLSVSQTTGKKLSYFGYEFEVPWDDIDESKGRIIGGNKAIIAFRSGNVLSVWSGSPREFVNLVLSSGKIDSDAFRQIYGDEALKSDYALHRIMLETTPAKITPFITKKKAVSGTMLLVVKAISAPRGADSAIFAVTAADFHGCQYGRPQVTPAGLSVELFGDNGSLDFIFGQKVSGPTVISQADINRILQTLHKVSDETVALKTKAGSVRF
jgi:hypothetical protein